MPLSKSQCFSLLDDMIDAANAVLSTFHVGEYIKDSYEDITTVNQIKNITLGEYTKTILGTIRIDVAPSMILTPIAVGDFDLKAGRVIWRSRKGQPDFEAITVSIPQKAKSGVTMGQWSTPHLNPFCRYQDIRGSAEKILTLNPYTALDNVTILDILKSAKRQKDIDEAAARKLAEMQTQRKWANETISKSEIDDLWNSL